MNRRSVLRTMTGTVLVGGLPAVASAGAAGAAGTSMGIATYALKVHRQQRWAGRHAGLAPAVALLEEARRLGAAGIQTELTEADLAHLGELRKRVERHGMHVEAIVRPPSDHADLGRFAEEIRRAKEVGAELARTVIIPGRRYERFRSLAEFREFARRGRESLERAEPVLARHRFRLAVENHKDQRTWERLELLESVGSEYVGMCVDVGNNFALMEDPLEVVEAFAPWAFTVHLKDQAVRATADGFLLADVALGEGVLDLPGMVKVLRAAKPGIRFNLETITRDAISVPVLRQEFWSTMGDTPASALARLMTVVRDSSEAASLPVVTELPPDRQLALELHNIQQSIRHAIDTLGI